MPLIHCQLRMGYGQYLNRCNPDGTECGAAREMWHVGGDPFLKAMQLRAATHFIGCLMVAMVTISACCLVRLSYGTNLFGPVCLTLVCSSPTHCRGTFLKPRPLACSKCAGRDPHSHRPPNALGLAKCKTTFFIGLCWPHPLPQCYP